MNAAMVEAKTSNPSLTRVRNLQLLISEAEEESSDVPENELEEARNTLKTLKSRMLENVSNAYVAMPLKIV